TATSVNGDAGATSFGAVGDVIAYSIEVGNDGNVTLTNVAVNDPLTGLSETIAVLAPGDSETFTTTYTVTQADIDGGSVQNVASATGTDPDGDPTDPATDEEEVDGPVLNPSLVVVKTATSVNGDAGATSFSAVGDVIAYSIEVSNDGNVTLTNIEVEDPLTGLSETIAELAPGDSETFTTSYTVTQADIDAGSVLNVASATGTDPDGEPTDPTTDEEEVDGPGSNPSLVVVKTATSVNGDAGATSFSEVGDVIAYSIEVSNDGNVTLTNIEVEDPLTGLSETIAELAPGDSETFTTSYTVTQADIDAGSVLNVASATGTDPDGEPTDPTTDEEEVILVPNEIEANDDDFGPINGTEGGTVPGNVLDNDTLNGDPVNPDDVILTPINVDPNSPVMINPDGTVTVAPNTPAGEYEVAYSICEVLNPDNCDTATVTVTVTAPGIEANDDDFGPINGTEGGTVPGNVLDNDTLNGDPVNPDDVILTPINVDPNSPVVINPDGTVTVAPNTPAGEYEVAYSICEVLNPDNCDTATVTVTVTAPGIEANDDDFGPINGTTGGTVPGNVLDNDTLNVDPVNPDDVILTPINVDPNSPVVINPDGTVTVAPNTPAGEYEVAYSICEVLNPGNCDTATVTVTVTAPGIEANDDNLGPINGTTGGTVPGNVLDNDTLNGDPVNPDDVILTPINVDPNSPVVINPDGTVTVAPNTPAGEYEVAYSICEVLNPGNCDTATVTVTVTAPGIEANDDNLGPINGTTGGTVPGNVLDNDTLNGDPVNPDDVILTPINVDPDSPVVINPDGTVTVAPNTPAGDYEVAYSICEVLNPGNCDTATVTVTVTAPAIEANDDDFGPINGTTGGTVPGNVLDNDTLNGDPVNPDDVILTPINVDPDSPVVINPDGTVTVAPNTPAGDY
ncbi:hypothetical protein MM213_20475, partial [Belliella sp. R4-6]